MQRAARTYRFGTFYACLNLAFAVYYGQLTYKAFHEGSMYLGHLFVCLYAVAMGMGLLRKEFYGLVLVYLGFLMRSITESLRWYRNAGYSELPESLRPGPFSADGRALIYFATMVLTVIIVGYFYKRRKEFSTP
jgi:hypothetical protein